MDFKYISKFCEIKLDKSISISIYMLTPECTQHFQRLTGFGFTFITVFRGFVLLNSHHIGLLVKGLCKH